jgi:hypothetical protein
MEIDQACKKFSFFNAKVSRRCAGVQTSVKLATFLRAMVNGSDEMALVAGNVAAIQEGRNTRDVAQSLPTTS